MPETRDRMRLAGTPLLALLALIAMLPAEAGVTLAETQQLDRPKVAHLAGLPTLAGRPLDARQMDGHAVAVAVFASWCGPCNTMFERLKLLHLGHAAEGLTVVAVNLSEEAEGTPEEGAARLEQFLGRHEPVFSVVRGTPETAKLFGGVRNLPALFVFDRSGRETYRFAPKDDGDGPAPDRSPDASPDSRALERAVRNALGVGAAGIRPNLPRPSESVTNPSYSNKFAVYLQ